MCVEVPADVTGAGVEGVEVAVVGAQVEGGAEAGGVGDGGGGVDVGAGLDGPVEPAGGGVVGVDAAVGVAEEDTAVEDGGGGVEVPLPSRAPSELLRQIRRPVRSEIAWTPSNRRSREGRRRVWGWP